MPASPAPKSSEEFGIQAWLGFFACAAVAHWVARRVRGDCRSRIQPRSRPAQAAAVPVLQPHNETEVVSDPGTLNFATKTFPPSGMGPFCSSAFASDQPWNAYS